MKRLLILIFILGLTSCTRIINWGRSAFNQGCKMDDFVCVPRQHIRTISVYDGFNTVGIFDGMWLSDAVRTSAVNLHAQKNYFTQDQRDIMLADEFSKNDKTISFYVLAWQYVRCGGLLDKPDAHWKVVLHTSSGPLMPRFVKRISLPCEYVTFFARRLNSFKKAFYIEFDGIDENGNKIINSTDHLTLCFSSLTKKTYLKWYIQDGKLICMETDSCDEIDKCDVCKDLKFD